MSRYNGVPWGEKGMEYNKGPCIGGPSDGKIKSVLYFSCDHPRGHEISDEELTIIRCFSRNFPEGMVYHWNEGKQEWHYQGIMENDGPAKELFNFFGVKTEPPL